MMRSTLARWAVGIPVAVGMLTLAGCDSLTGPDYDDISGSWSLPVSGTLGPNPMSGTLGVSLTQQDGTLAGTWNSTMVVAGITFIGGGQLEGTVAEGRNPAVSITALYPPGSCYQPMHFTGSNDSAAQVVTVSGNVGFYDGCSLVGLASMTLRLAK